MIHDQESGVEPSRVKSRGAHGPLSGLILMLLAIVGCGDTTTVVPTPRFAQVGEIRIDVERPSPGANGLTQATLVWRSSGRWALVERIVYRGETGDERVLNSRLNPGQLTTEYQTLNRQLNENPGLRLIGEVDDDLIPQCTGPRSRVRVTMVDTHRDEIAQWTRCTEGDLFGLSSAAAGPDPEASRVISAAQLVRSFTLGDQSRSAFEGSIPFATIDRGEDSPARPEEPRVFLSEEGVQPEGWLDFWQRHAGPDEPLPSVDWTEEMILVGSPGLRIEAGYRARVRRVLPVGTATRVEMLEEIPGDFCSPAARDRYPYHIVVAPLGPRPVSFSEPQTLRVPCGS